MPGIKVQLFRYWFFIYKKKKKKQSVYLENTIPLISSLIL